MCELKHATTSLRTARRSVWKLNRGLVHIACALSNMDFKDPDANGGKELVRAGHIEIPSVREANSPKQLLGLRNLRLMPFPTGG